MTEASSGNSFAVRVTAPIYAFLYYTIQHHFLGFTISGYLKNLPLLFSLLSFIWGWPFLWIGVGIILAVLVRLLYWKAKRNGYIIFITGDSRNQPTTSEPFPENQKVELQATGTFSVNDLEDYVVRQPAEYWRVPLGDHTIMVKSSQGKFLYQFVQPGAVEQIKSGKLCFGTRSEPALSITYLSTWGPGAGEVSFMFFSPGKNDDPAKVQRKIILSFNTEAQKDAVWFGLLTSAD